MKGIGLTQPGVEPRTSAWEATSQHSSQFNHPVQRIAHSDDASSSGSSDTGSTISTSTSSTTTSNNKIKAQL